MKYQGRTPEEIVRNYRRGLRVKQGLILLVFAAYLASIFHGIWRLGSGLPTVLLAIVLLVLLTLPLSVWISWDFLSLNLILNQNCDPVTYTEVCRLLRKTHQRRRNRLATAINEAIGTEWCGRFSQALAMVESLAVPEKDVSSQLLVRSVRFNCFARLGDLDSARRVKEEMERYAAAIRKPALQKWGAQILKIMDLGLAFQTGDYETVRRLERELSAGYSTNIQKVTSAFRLARADLAQGESQNARARLEMVVEQGGTLHIVETARELLAELERGE